MDTTTLPDLRPIRRFFRAIHAPGMPYHAARALQVMIEIHHSPNLPAIAIAAKLRSSQSTVYKRLVGLRDDGLVAMTKGRKVGGEHVMVFSLTALGFEVVAATVAKFHAA